MSQFHLSTKAETDNNVQPNSNPIIIGIDCWPALETDYQFVLLDVKPALQLTFRFNYQYNGDIGYETSIRRMIQYLAIYTQVKAQLDLETTGDNTTSLLSYSVECSLDPANKTILNVHEVGKLKVFVNDVINKLERVINGGESTEEVKVTFVIPVQMNNQSNVFRLNLNFNISNLTTNNGKRYTAASSSVTPLVTDTDALQQWVESFEQVFGDTQSAVKIALNEENKANVELWVIRMALTGEAAGLSYLVNAVPVAALPLSTELVYGEVNIKPYQDGKLTPDGGGNATFSAIDINVWVSDFLKTLDQIDGGIGEDIKAKFNVSGSEAFIGRLKTAKNSLSDALASIYKPIPYGSLFDAACSFANAREWLQHKLNNCYTSTLVQYQVETKIQVADPECFINGIVALDEEIPGVAVSQIALPGLFPALGVTDSLANLRNYLPLNTNFTPTHLVLNGANHSKKSLKIQKNPGKVGVFLNAPLLNFTYPQSPLISGFGTVRSEAETGANLQNARKATLQFKLQADIVAQDEIAFKLHLNNQPQPQAVTPATNDMLFMALAQFISIQPALLADLESYLNLEPEKRTDEGFTKFVTCLETFTDISLKVAGALASTNVKESNEGTPIETGDFMVSIKTARPLNDNRLVLELTNQNHDRPVKVSVDGFNTVVFAEDNRITDNSQLKFIFKNGNDTLTIDDAKTMNLNIEISGIDVLQTENITILERVIRNNKPLRKPIDNAFVFSTPFNVVATLQPANVWTDANVDLSTLTIDAGAQGAKAYLSALFKSLLQDTVSLGLNIAMNISCKTLLNGDLSNPLWATNPVLLVPDAIFDLQNENQLADDITDKLKIYQESRGVDVEKSRYTFDIKLNSASSKRSLLSIEQLYLPANKIF